MCVFAVTEIQSFSLLNNALNPAEDQREQTAGRCLYVGNIEKRVTETELREFLDSNAIPVRL